MPVRPEELPQMPVGGEFDSPIVLSQAAMQRIGDLCGVEFLEPQREALLVLARSTTSEQNQRLLHRNPNILHCLREFLDKNNHDSIQRLSLAVLQNMFQISEHREFAADNPSLVANIQALLDETDSNQVKFLILACLESLAHSHPSLVYQSGVDLYERHRGCSDDRIQSVCQNIIDLQLVA